VRADGVLEKGFGLMTETRRKEKGVWGEERIGKSGAGK